jgi:hypothetical protein
MFLEHASGNIRVALSGSTLSEDDTDGSTLLDTSTLLSTSVELPILLH